MRSVQIFSVVAGLDEGRHAVVDRLLGGDPPQIHITHAKRQADRYVPILPELADELRTHLQGRQKGFLFESNRHTCYSSRMVQSIVKDCALQAGIAKPVVSGAGGQVISTLLGMRRVKAARRLEIPPLIPSFRE